MVTFADTDIRGSEDVRRVDVSRVIVCGLCESDWERLLRWSASRTGREEFREAGLW